MCTADQQTQSILVQLFLEEEIVIPATTGRRTIANARDVFPAYINPYFEKWNTTVLGKPTDPCSVSVYELRSEATFVEMFGVLADDVHKLVLEQEQILVFCKEHPEKLRQDRCATFFLIEAHDELFVVSVDIYPNGPETDIRRYALSITWSEEARYRVVVPKDTALLL